MIYPFLRRQSCWHIRDSVSLMDIWLRWCVSLFVTFFIFILSLFIVIIVVVVVVVVVVVFRTRQYVHQYILKGSLCWKADFKYAGEYPPGPPTVERAVTPACAHSKRQWSHYLANVDCAVVRNREASRAHATRMAPFLLAGVLPIERTFLDSAHTNR